MRVTELELDTRSGGVRVRLDGAPFGAVTVQEVSALGLAVGRELTERQERELARRAEVHSARAVALRMLARRPLPAREMERRLLRKGHPRPAVEACVAGLAAAGLINDAEFARHYARTRARRRLGTARLLAELRALGVAEREAETAVREALEAEGVDQRAMLREAAERKLAGLRGLARDRKLRRVRAYLRRRGFTLAEIREVLQGVE